MMELAISYLGEPKIGALLAMEVRREAVIDYAVRLGNRTAIVASEVEYCNPAEDDL